MTNKSLSQQICKACGIEPIEEKYCYHECKNPEYKDKPCNKTKCEHYKHIVHYIDFENNNDNFVHLMELEIPYKNNETITLFNISEYYVEQYIPRKKVDYLICLLTFLTDSENDKSKMSKVKEIIREAKWEV